MSTRWNPIVSIGDRPKYVALVETIEADVLSGILKPGDRLPSNRELGEMFGVTVATVTKAMAEAGRRGIVDARVGSGTYVCETPTPTEAKQGVLDLATGTLPTSVVEDILQASLDKMSPEKRCEYLFSYSQQTNSEHHRSLGAAWITSLGAEVSPDRVLLTTGAHQGLFAAFRVLLSPGESAVCEALTYIGIRRIAEYRGVHLVGAACDENGLVPEEVERALRESKAKVLIVTSSLHNPTTATLPMERRQAIAAICRKLGVQIIEDGINAPVANHGMPALMTLAPERTIYLTGFSKCIASGFRLGYAAMPPPLLESFSEALVSAQWIGPGFFAELASEMFGSGMIEECIVRHRAEAAERTLLAQQILTGVHVSGSSAYHAWVSTPHNWTADDFSAQALRVGIKVSPASHFAVDPAQSPLAYRISLGAISARSDLLAALNQLARIGRDNQAAFNTLV